MAQLDNPKSITMLFTGAFLISLGVIAFFNMEIQSRSSHGTKIRNENMFESLGRKISQMFMKLRERNAHRRSILYHFLTSENATRTSLRKLQHYAEEPSDKQQQQQQQQQQRETFEQNRNRSLHHFRHEKKMRRLTDLKLRQKTNVSSRVQSRWGNDDDDDDDDDDDARVKTSSNNISVFLSHLKNETVKYAVKSNGSKSGRKNNETNGETANVTREKLEPHKNCYTTNDVLEIIAITCLVNFIFWFTIITCVNIFTRNQKVWKSDSCESLDSIGNGLEYELSQNDLKKSNESSPKHSSNHQSVLHDYVSLWGDSPEQDSKSFIRDQPKVAANKNSGRSQERIIDPNKWRRRRLIHLHNIFFDSTCLDEAKPMIKKKKRTFKN